MRVKGLECATFRAYQVLLQQGRNLMIFRISRILLDSINRHVNIEKQTRDFGEEFMALKEAIFQVYSFPFCFIL
jgi:hypothetical protein